MTYSEAISLLSGLRQFGMRLGLETITRLAGLAGNPHDRLKFIHVAGTNGKGSTCALLESVYRCAGYRVGLFTSPHLVHFGERIQVDREPLAPDRIIEWVQFIQPWLAGTTRPGEEECTFFEAATLMALLEFERCACDVVIWETGLGGRLDATNLVTPLASLITTIGFDHTQWLGNTLEAIAGEKAGILKPGVPAWTTVSQPGALESIEEVARQTGAPLYRVDPSSPSFERVKQLPLSLMGAHQQLNAALAVAALDGLQSTLPVGSVAIQAGLQSAQWPGRLQEVSQGNRTLWIDGAHNAEAARVLRAALSVRCPGARMVFILGVLSDKPWKEMVEILAPLALRFLFVPVQSERSASPDELATEASLIAPGVPCLAVASLDIALEQAGTASRIVIAGSLYLVGQALERLGLMPKACANERFMNDWRPR